MKVGILNITGYGGIELARILNRHPEFEITSITGRSASGKQLADIFPHLSVLDLTIKDQLDEGLDIVFSALPHAASAKKLMPYIEKGQRVIDFSADFRLNDPKEYQFWYGTDHPLPSYLNTATYGLPELNREQIKNAELVANPGCYPTAIQLGFLPLLEQDLVHADSLIADAKSGVSGAGRKAAMTSQFCEAADSFKAYSVEGHRHLPEIKQSLQKISKEEIDLVFVPHLTPMIRGIHATLYARLKDTSIDLQQVFAQRYKHEPFVDLMPSGSHPDTSSVRGSNSCRLACHRPQDGSTVVVLAVEDNLVKGAAGQAIQNMNLMFSLPETTGLTAPAVYP